jgi:hypothetical protein
MNWVKLAAGGAIGCSSHAGHAGTIAGWSAPSATLRPVADGGAP